MFMWVNGIIEYWMTAPWIVAFLMVTGVHMCIYFLGGKIGELLTTRIWPKFNIGSIIDQHPPEKGQVRIEIKNGIIACFVFGLISLSYRVICNGIWPSSWLQAAFQFAVFIIFYNFYGYITHRLLHTRYLRKIHHIHHRSQRVTPWSGYSVHPIEAAIMGATIPVFMIIMPIGVGTSFVLHALGMMFTTCIHCNYDLAPRLAKKHWFRQLVNDPAYHRLHHTIGNVNYGFTFSIMDRIFKTYEPNMFDEFKSEV